MEHVRMRVDEPGHDGRAAHVDVLRVRAGDPLHRRTRARRDHTPVPDDERLGGWRHAVADDDTAATIERRDQFTPPPAPRGSQLTPPPPPGGSQLTPPPAPGGSRDARPEDQGMLITSVVSGGSRQV